MLCGCLPFDDESKSALYDKILACKFSLPKSLSPEAADLLKKMLVRDPDRRPSLEEILDHPFMRKHPSSEPAGDASTAAFSIGALASPRPRRLQTHQLQDEGRPSDRRPVARTQRTQQVHHAVV